ncbi:MAG: bacillithiol biosynthesis cysteine-adding enzyme BshC [Bacteroidia bacterium]
MKTANSDIRTDYLTGAPNLRPFYQYPLQNPDFRAIIEAKAKEDIDRQLLSRVISEQYAGLPEVPAVSENIERLSSPNTFTVTTGHQLALFGGPLFTTYKVLSTARLAADLKAQFPEYQFVPVFWIHTEDHDFEEINHFYSAFNQKHTYPGKFAGAVGEHVLETSIKSLVPSRFHGTLAAAFSPGKPLKDAYREFMHSLFAPYGVVMLDASDPRLKARFREVMRAEVNAGVAQKEVSRVSELLEELGYPAQITARDINLFYSDENGRDRITKNGQEYEVVGRNLQFSPEALNDIIENHPEKISPNVSLRPLYQEMILPNLAYFGGWGEIAYWFQLKGVFDHFGVNYPLILPRMSATIFTRDVWQTWKDLGFPPSEIGKPMHELYRQFMPNIWDETTFRQISEEIIAKILAMKSYIEAEVSPTLPRSVEGQKVKMERFVANLEKKIHRVKRADNAAIFSRIESAKLAIQPEGLVQERILSLAAFPDATPEKIIAAAWEACSPLDFTHRYLVLD